MNSIVKKNVLQFFSKYPVSTPAMGITFANSSPGDLGWPWIR